jgi:hypothetical protein
LIIENYLVLLLKSKQKGNPFFLSPSFFATASDIKWVNVFYERRNTAVGFVAIERWLPRSYKQNSIPPTFSKSKLQIHAPQIAQLPRLSLRNNIIPVFVKSAGKNYERRSLLRKIRDILEPQMEKYVVDLIFVFGQQDTTKMSQNDYDIWNREREVFGDFLIGDFVDSYSNLPLKLWIEILL